MKFLVQSDVFPEAPVDRLAELFERTRGQVARGDSPVKVECAYGVLGGRGAVAIVDAPDAESLHALLTSAPLFCFERFTVTPLVAFDAFLTGMSTAAAAAAAAPASAAAGGGAA
jgi:muconolactone delta-isomerase